MDMYSVVHYQNRCKKECVGCNIKYRGIDGLLQFRIYYHLATFFAFIYSTTSIHSLSVWLVKDTSNIRKKCYEKNFSIYYSRTSNKFNEADGSCMLTFAAKGKERRKLSWRCWFSFISKLCKYCNLFSRKALLWHPVKKCEMFKSCFMEHVIEDKQRALETVFLFVRCNLDPFKGKASHRAFFWITFKLRKDIATEK